MVKKISKQYKKDKIYKIVTYIIIIIVVLVTIYPLLVSLTVSFKPGDEVQKYPPTFLPKHPTIANYIGIFVGRDFLRYILNTLYVAGVTTVISLIIGIMAAYVLSRYTFAGSRSISQFILFVYMFPAVLLVIPLYLLLNSWGLIDNHLSIIIAYTTFSIPLCIWLLKGFFDGLPKDIEDAAKIDGCSDFSALIRVILPLSTPGILSAGAFSFMVVWMEYMFSMTFITSGDRLTLTAGLATIVGQYWAGYGLIMAGGILSTIPAILLFFVAQRFVIKGLLAGAIKE